MSWENSNCRGPCQASVCCVTTAPSGWGLSRATAGPAAQFWFQHNGTKLMIIMTCTILFLLYPWGLSYSLGSDVFGSCRGSAKGSLTCLGKFTQLQHPPGKIALGDVAFLESRGEACLATVCIAQLQPDAQPGIPLHWWLGMLCTRQEFSLISAAPSQYKPCSLIPRDRWLQFILLQFDLGDQGARTNPQADQRSSLNSP